MSRRSYAVPVVLLLLGVLAAQLLLTRVQSPPVQSSWINYEAARGWPWLYSRSVKTNDPASGVPGAWISTDFSWLALVADVALLLTALAVAGLLLCRRHRRLGRLLRFSLGEILILVTIAAIACGWVSLQYRHWRREQQTLASFPSGTFSTHNEYRGPEWLRRIMPGEKLTIFNRAVEVSANDAVTDKTTVASLARLLTNAPYIHELDSRATLTSDFIEPAPFTNIDEVCLFSDGSADDVEYALAQIARWPQVCKLTIEAETRQSFRSGFGRRPSEKSGTLTQEDLEWLLRPGPRRPWSPQTNLTNAAMKLLAQMPALKYLAVADSPGLTSEGIRNLAESTSLVSVSLPDSPLISDESLKLLANRVKDVYLIHPDGGSRRFDPNKRTSIDAGELFSESGSQE